MEKRMVSKISKKKKNAFTKFPHLFGKDGMETGRRASKSENCKNNDARIRAEHVATGETVVGSNDTEIMTWLLPK